MTHSPGYDDPPFTRCCGADAESHPPCPECPATRPGYTAWLANQPKRTHEA